MKKLFLKILLSTSLIAAITCAQSSDSTIISNDEILYKIIETAWENYPKNKVFQHLLEHADEKVFQESYSWLNTVNVTWQYVPNNLTNETFFSRPPQLGFGLILNVGSIFSTPSRVRQAKQERFIAEANLDNQRNYIAAEVMRRYYKYKENLELYKVHLMAAEDSETVMKMIKYRFEKGEVNLEEYSRSLTLFTDGQENLLKTKGKVNGSKYSLEEILGVKLEDVL